MTERELYMLHIDQFIEAMLITKQRPLRTLGIWDDPQSMVFIRIMWERNYYRWHFENK